MKRTLVVHIGNPKAGSTSIQRMLHRLSFALEHAGVYVPVAGRDLGKHRDLTLYPGAFSYHRTVEGWEDLLYEVQRRGAAHCVVSNESLSQWFALGAERAGRMAAMIRDAACNVEVVGYVRPQYQYLQSRYCQAVKSGRVSSPFETYLADALNCPAFNYERVFRPWREAFGERLAVYPLEATRMSGGLLAHFLGLLGAHDIAPAAAALPRMNERLGAKHVEVLRLTRLALDDRSLDRKTASKRLAPVRAGVPALLDGDAPFTGLSPGKVRAVTEHFAASNARFAREYGIDAGGVLFREPEADTGARPNLVEWRDFGAAERRRVRDFVQEAVGVELPPVAAVAGTARAGRRSGGAGSRGAGDRAAPPGGVASRLRQPLHAAAGRTRQRFRWRARRLVSHARKVMGMARCMRGPRDLPAFLRWLWWSVEWWLRRTLRAMARALR